MFTILTLLALSALSGLALGASFSWHAIALSGFVLAGFSAAVLHVSGFDALSGIAIIVGCLILNQLAYFAGLLSRDHVKTAGSSIRQAKVDGAKNWTKSH